MWSVTHEEEQCVSKYMWDPSVYCRPYPEAEDCGKSTHVIWVEKPISCNNTRDVSLTLERVL